MAKPERLRRLAAKDTDAALDHYLRCWPLPRFPYLVMYVERATEIDVWRVLHTRRDIPRTLVDANEQ